MNKYYVEKKKKVIQDISPKVIRLPFKWALAINICDKVYSIRNLTKTELQHELIHSLQMKTLGYTKFYFSYIYEWVKLFIKHRNLYEAYLNISFEKEAYKYQNDIDYIIDKYEYFFKKSWHIL